MVRALVVDDSRIGRRMIQSSLPEEWEVEITEAVAWLDVRRTDLARVIDVGDVVDLGLDPRQTRILGQ